MPTDRLWLHWLILIVSGGAAVAAALFTPDIGWLRLGLGVFGGVLVVIGIAGAFDIGWGERGDGGAVEGEAEPGRSAGPPTGGDEEAERLREVGDKVRGEPEEDVSVEGEEEGPSRG